MSRSKVYELHYRFQSEFFFADVNIPSKNMMMHCIYKHIIRNNVVSSTTQQIMILIFSDKSSQVMKPGVSCRSSKEKIFHVEAAIVVSHV